MLLMHILVSFHRMTELVLVQTNRSKPLQPAAQPSTLLELPPVSYTLAGPRTLWGFGCAFFPWNWNVEFVGRGNNGWIWEGLRGKVGRSLLPPVHPESLGSGQGMGFGAEDSSKTQAWGLEMGGQGEQQPMVPVVLQALLHPWVWAPTSSSHCPWSSSGQAQICLCPQIYTTGWHPHTSWAAKAL